HGVRVFRRCRWPNDGAAVVDRPRRSASGASAVDRGSGGIVRGDTRDPGSLIVMPGGDILLCDEYTQGGFVEGVHADAVGSAASAGDTAGRRGDAAGRVAGGADPALRQGWLPLCRRRTARPLCLLRTEDGGPGAA